ncbi:Pectin acetylesterase [Melia azedarach]|uniref:Pectin acetylesterase n=1 Tax=Melia azedarach TaxID=155640 RepID=A0ACC1Y2S5_MELAZ|nr:Pectin acetylesterase [Melia azedarach]
MEIVLEEIASVIAKHKASSAVESKTTLMSSKSDVPVLAKKSFASILSAIADDLPTHPSQLPPPRYKGDQVVIKIDQKEYNKRMGLSKSNIIGRLILKRSFEPIKVDDLKAGLNKL